MQIETLNPIKIRVFGEERFDFLQNIITNDLTKLKKELKSYILSPQGKICLLYTSPSPRDIRRSRMPSSA